MRTVAVVIAALTVCVLSGCVSPPPVVRTDQAQPQTLRPEGQFVDPDILALCPELDAVHLDTYSALPEGIYLCAVLDGPREVAYRLTDPFTVLAAYSVPNAERTPDGCLDYLADPLILWIHGAGTIRAVYAPVDGCGFPQEAARDAYRDADRDLVAEAVGR